VKVDTTHVSREHGTQQFISAHNDMETSLMVTVVFLSTFWRWEWQRSV